MTSSVVQRRSVWLGRSRYGVAAARWRYAAVGREEAADDHVLHRPAKQRLAWAIQIHRGGREVEIRGGRDPEVSAVEPEPDARLLALSDEPPRPADPAEEPEPEHEGVGDSQLPREGHVGRVRRERDRRRPPQLRHVGERADRLLDVRHVERLEERERALGGVQPPAHVRVEAQLGTRSDGRAYLADEPHVLLDRSHGDLPFEHGRAVLLDHARAVSGDLRR